LYRLCIKGGKEEHTALLSSVQDLAKAFSRYEDEVLVMILELVLSCIFICLWLIYTVGDPYLLDHRIQIGHEKCIIGRKRGKNRN